MTNKQVAPGIEFNGDWYTVTTPEGEVWTFDEEDKNLSYIGNAVTAWKMWGDYVAREAYRVR